MKLVSLKSLLVAASLTALGVSLASAGTTTAAGTANAPTVTAPVVRPTMPPIPSDLQALFDTFAADRATIMTNRKAALDALKTATTAADRQAIIDTLHAQNASLRQDQTALGKQIRDQMRALRKAQPKPGGG